MVVCSQCSTAKTRSQFSKTQLRKGAGRRCRVCVDTTTVLARHDALVSVAPDLPDHILHQILLIAYEAAQRSYSYQRSETAVSAVTWRIQRSETAAPQRSEMAAPQRSETAVVTVIVLMNPAKRSPSTCSQHCDLLYPFHDSRA